MPTWGNPSLRRTSGSILAAGPRSTRRRPSTVPGSPAICAKWWLRCWDSLFSACLLLRPTRPLPLTILAQWVPGALTRWGAPASTPPRRLGGVDAGAPHRVSAPGTHWAKIVSGHGRVGRSKRHALKRESQHLSHHFAQIAGLTGPVLGRRRVDGGPAAGVEPDVRLRDGFPHVGIPVNGYADARAPRTLDGRGSEPALPLLPPTEGIGPRLHRGNIVRTAIGIGLPVTPQVAVAGLDKVLLEELERIKVDL